MDKELTILIFILVLILLIFILIPLTFMFPMFQMHMQMMGSSFLPSPLFFVFLIIAIIALIIGLVLVIRYVFEKETTKKETNEVKKVYVFPLTEEEKKK
jgi:membrane protein implicated in regulation of membrane protease activity